MSWSWSHTAEAYANAEQNLRELPRETLEVIWAEWEAAIPHPRFGIGFHATLNLRQYMPLLAKAKRLPTETLADSIWPRMRELATCTNGGWKAWCCPFGCHWHRVSFSRRRAA